MITNKEITVRLKETCKPFDVEFVPCLHQPTVLVTTLTMMTQRCGVDVAFDREEVIQRPDDDTLKDFVHNRIKNRLTELIGYAKGLLDRYANSS